MDEDTYYKSKTYLKKRKTLIENKGACAYCGNAPLEGFSAHDEQYVYCNEECKAKLTYMNTMTELS